MPRHARGTARLRLKRDTCLMRCSALQKGSEMTRPRHPFITLTTLATASILAACTNAYPALEFTPEGDALRLQGVIDARALDAFDEALAANPNVNRLIFDFVPGSADDESNLMLARRVRELELSTIIPESGLTASGGTDLFLAGVKRSISSSACVGVHTWGDDSVGIGSEVPKDHPIHQMYLAYYQDMDIPASFYWFTLDAAGPDDSHWMSVGEIESYRMTTEAIETSEVEPQAERRPRCEIRFNGAFEQLLARE